MTTHEREYDAKCIVSTVLITFSIALTSCAYFVGNRMDAPDVLIFATLITASILAIMGMASLFAVAFCCPDELPERYRKREQ